MSIVAPDESPSVFFSVRSDRTAMQVTNPHAGTYNIISLEFADFEELQMYAKIQIQGFLDSESDFLPLPTTQITKTICITDPETDLICLQAIIADVLAKTPAQDEIPAIRQYVHAVFKWMQLRVSRIFSS